MAVPISEAASFHQPAASDIVERSRRQRRWRTIQQVLYGFGFPIALFALWELLVAVDGIDRRFFPAPSQIFLNAVSLLSDPSERAAIFADVIATYGRLVIGFLLGSFFGILVGLSMALYTPLRFGLGPMVYATYPTPKLAIFPLLIVIFGLGDASKTALVTLGVFYMTCISTLGGVLYASPIYGDVAQAFRMPARVRWLKVVIPSAMPEIVTGLKLGLGQALILVVSAEFIASQDGLGSFIWNSWQILDISRMFMGLIIVALTGGIAMLLGILLERRLIPWAAD